ncbi:MAG: carbon-nitrogen hydrolase [Ignavibacteriae bacterium]|nr:carbon-nitrogen hydrolase [Ignavibacteriota bacterium]
MNFKVAIAQVDSRVGDVEHNLHHHIEYVERARELNAKLILFPELSLTGYTLRDLAWEMALDAQSAPALKKLRDASASISIIAGFAESAPDHGIYNSALFLEAGEIRHIHRKIYPPTYGMFEEGRYFSPGKEIRAFDSKLGRLGMLVCEDSWHMSLPYLLAVDGANILCCLTASPTRIASDNKELDNATVNHEHLRVYARLLSSYVLFSNRVGFEDGVNFWGGSIAFDPSGNVVKQAQLFKEDLIVFEVDTNEIQRARRFSRHFLDENIDIVKKNLQQISKS